jgi:hypothetical protein
VYRSALLVRLVPPTGVLTVTSTVPVPGGEVAVMVVELRTVNVAALAPKSTALAPVKPVPVIVTAVPPPAVSMFGLTPVTMGTGNPELVAMIDTFWT